MALNNRSSMKGPGLLLPIAFLIGCASLIGEQFRDVDSITLSKAWREWVIVGSFGPTGPFELKEFKTCAFDEPCSFLHNSQSHVYDHFDGYKLTVLVLENSDGEVSHVVLRSKLNRYGDG